MVNLKFDPQLISTFWKHLSTPIPDRLHHYTIQEGLIGIIESESLRATKVQYMNDATELKLGLELANERISHYRKSQSAKEKEFLLDQLADAHRGISGVNIFVACFCEDNDLLSQWRGYSGDTHGFAIGFSTTRLHNLCRQSNFQIARCIYEQSIQTKIIDELIEYCLKHERPTVAVGEFTRGLLSMIAFFKHVSFKDEQEWRVVSGVKSITEAGTGFRPGKSMLVPFFELGIGKGANSAIRSATVGPCPHMDLSLSSALMLFFKHSINVASLGAEVLPSKIPFRNW